MTTLSVNLRVGLLFALVLGTPMGLAAPNPSGQWERLTSDFSTPVRVLLAKGLNEAKIETTSGPVYFSQNGTWIRSQGPSIVSVGMDRGSPRLKLNNAWLRTSVIFFHAERPAGRLRFQADVFEGQIKVTLRAAQLVVTNVLSMEKYLAGTVSSEMLANWDIEALKSQAVASRSYTLYMMRHARNPLYDLERGVEDQVYGGAVDVPAKVRQAIESTKGVFLSDHREPLKAFFHSRCGGQTEVPGAVWGGGKPSAHAHQSVVCPYCSRHPFAWKTIIKLTDLFSALKWHPLMLKSFAMRPVVKTPTGRIASLALTADGKQKEVSLNELRGALGYSKIKSGFFDLKIDERYASFEGVGSGHGVGMCQWGAEFMAKQGKTYREILAYFYPSAKIVGEAPGVLVDRRPR